MAQYLDIPVIISMHNGKPALILKKSVTDPAILRAIIHNILDEQPVTTKLYFKKPHLQINNCLQKGILYREKNNSYKFVDY